MVSRVAMGFALWLMSTSGFALAPSTTMNFEEAFQKALLRSETILITDQQILQAEAVYAQVRASLFPSIFGSATFLQQDTPPAGTASGISPASQQTVKLTAQQPLFRGFREYAAIRQQNLSIEASRVARASAAKLLFSDVTDAFHQVLLQTQDIQNLEDEIKINQHRLSDLRGFVRIGRSRQTEVLTVEANVATLEAQAETGRALLLAQREVLAFLTGQPAETSLVDSVQVPEASPELASFLAGISTRPDVQAQDKLFKISEEGVTIARGGHYPSLDLYGNYYFVRPGFLSSVLWDVSLVFTLPIFQGGLITAQVHAASALMMQNQFLLQGLRRSSEQEIRTLFGRLASDKLQLQKYRLADDLNQKNYAAVQRDYKLGLVTNIEVLQILTATQQARRAFDQTRYITKIDFLKLDAASGRRAF